MTAPSFTTLLDWVDDRLGAQDAAAIERFVSRSPDTQEVVDWIRGFREAGHALPLADVPETLAHDLRAAFRRHRAPWISGPRRELNTTFDSRQRPAVAGMRTTLATPVERVVITSEDTTELRLTLVGGDRDVVDLRGALTIPPGSGTPEIVISSTKLNERRSARPGHDGTFVLQSVNREFDEVWLLADRHHLHGFIDLSPPASPGG